MNTDFFVSWQFGMTLLAALGIGIWQWFRIQGARKRRGETLAAPPGDPPTT